jgi:hypothetical protein
MLTHIYLAYCRLMSRIAILRNPRRHNRWEKRLALYSLEHTLREVLAQRRT